jgi:hypothetical protein
MPIPVLDDLTDCKNDRLNENSVAPARSVTAYCRLDLCRLS